MRKADHSSCVVLVAIWDFNEETIVDPVKALLMVWGAPKEINHPNVVLSDKKLVKLLWRIWAGAALKTDVLRRSRNGEG
jgi:hypothetical protein